jgi:hypothetical protein
MKSNDVSKMTNNDDEEYTEIFEDSDSYVKKKVSKMKDKYTNTKNIKYSFSIKKRLVTLTWNMGSKFPEKSISSLLHLDQFEADIYLIW